MNPYSGFSNDFNADWSYNNNNNNNNNNFQGGYRGRAGPGSFRGRGRGSPLQTDAFGRNVRDNQGRDDSFGPPAVKIQMTPEERSEALRQVEARIEQERPCRTLFVRNIKYNADSNEIRSNFAAMGEIKSFFDLLSTRGMVFITYFDVRCASLAKERMQGYLVGARPIDVHYSLPKEEEQQGRCTGDKNQGSLYVRVRNAQQPFDDRAFRDRINAFGDIRTCHNPPGAPPTDRLIEFYDSRATAEAYKKLNNTDFIGGTFEIDWAWDESTLSGLNDADRPAVAGRGRDHRRGRGNPFGDRGGGPFGDRGGGRPRYDDRGPPPQRSGRDRDFGRSPPPSSYGRDYRDYRQRSRSPPPRRYDDRYPPAVGPSHDSDPYRLSEAQRVQQLLASLVPGGANPQMPQMPPAAPQQYGYPPAQPPPQPAYGYQNPQPPYQPPPVAQYSVPPPIPPSHASAPPAPASLPPAVLALLNQTNAQSLPPQPQAPPQQPQQGAPPPPQGDQVKALLAMLQQSQQRK